MTTKFDARAYEMADMLKEFIRNNGCEGEHVELKFALNTLTERELEMLVKMSERALKRERNASRYDREPNMDGWFNG